MQRWLTDAGIKATNLSVVRILKGRVIFRATFERPADAERFAQAFDEPYPR
jgi:hypothetical protein